MRRFLISIFALFAICMSAVAKEELQLSEGVTVAGKVTCNGEPMVGVTVSDGALFTQTDSLGVYQLHSLKYYGSVFVITPSGYEPTVKRGIMPQFWAPLNSRKMQKVERHDFELKKVDNNRHRVIFAADLHISGRNDDMLQFKRLCIPAFKNAVEQVRDSIPVYSIFLGDLCRNDSWYSQEIDPTDVLSLMATMHYPTMVYTVMGENEYDGAVPAGAMTDHQASELYATSCAPRFYSLNIGQVHYVVLDNIVFRNDPGDGKYPTEIVGKRNFDSRVSADCLAWLRRDLELVKDKSTPIMVCMHHGAIRKSNKGSLVKSFTKPEYVDSLIAAFKDFSTVRFITAHAHRRRVSDPKELKNITEHTITPLGGNGWESSYNGFDHMCSDGATAGFEIFDYDGRDVKWSYRSVHDEKRTFRAYDMNSVMEYYRQNEDVKAMVQAYPNKRVNYGIANFANYVYINYWADEPKAKLEVWEGDKKLKPRRVYQDDPLFTIASVVVRHKNSRGRKLNFGRNSSQHLFRVKTDTATTVVKIRATDPFGRTFIDSLVRPTPFPPKAHKL